MFPVLLRRCAKALPLLMFVLLAMGVRPAQASHYLGGELSYRYLDANGGGATPFRYEITVLIYFNNYGPDNPTPPNGSQILLSIYNKSLGNSRIFGDIVMPRVNLSGSIQPSTPGGCVLPAAPRPFILGVYQSIVSLPASFTGYYALVNANARNYGITNINTGSVGNPVARSLTLYSDMSSPLVPNSSPVFSDTAVAVICQGRPNIIINNATDADGDRLVYSFGAPASQNATNTFTPPPTAIPYNGGGFSVINPFGPGGSVSLNANTGIATYFAPTAGLYVIAVDVSEYRTINGVEQYIGVSRRDVQLVVNACPTNDPPVLPPSTGGGGGVLPRNYSIQEGASLSFNISATDPNGDPLSLELNSSLLDGTRANGFDAALNGNQGTVVGGNLTGTASVAGTGTVNGTFVFNSHCGQARAATYDIVATVKDGGCGGQSVADVFQITVTKGAPPTGITGPAQVCDPATVRTYTAVGPTPANGYNWHLSGGTILSGQGTNTVTVRFNSAAATGVLSLKNRTQYNCFTDSVTKNIDIRPVGTLTLTPASASICQGGNTVLTIGGPTGLTYTIPGLTVTGNTVTVSPTATTTYTVTGTDPATLCSATTTATVTVTPLPTANAGADRTICQNGTAQLGAAAVAGVTYSWNPAAGLNNPNIANPITTLAAVGSVTYTLTASAGPGCTSTDQVTVTSNPLPVADAGPNRSTCSGVASAPLGSPAVAGYTYSWSPATGLSSATAAQPTVTLPNTTGSPITQTYTLTVSMGTAPVCTATSTVVVTINPAAVANPTPTLAFCSGATATLGGVTAVAGTTYSWSPTTGLSDPTLPNPTITLTNAGSTPVTTTYTLTATTSNGCFAVGTVAVTVNPLPVANAGPDRSICPNGSAQLGMPAVAGYTYSWSPTAGLNNPNIAQPTVTLPNAGATALTTTYTLTVSGGTTPACTATSTVTVTVNPLPVANAGPNQTICANGSAQLGTTGVAGYTYSWSPTTGLSDPTAAQPMVTLPNAGPAAITQTYTLTVSSGTTPVCTATSTVTVTVNPLPIANAGPNRTICENGTTVLGSPRVVGYTYSWSPTTGLNDPTLPQPTATLPTAGSFTYTLTVSSNTTPVCTATSSVTVTVLPLPIANAGPAVSTCSGVASVPLGSPAVAGNTYSWSPATGLSSATSAQPTVTLPNTTGAPITQTYTLTVTSGTTPTCTATSTVVVTINPAAVANPTPTLAFCSGATATLGGVTAVAGTTYSWSPTTGLSDPTLPNPTITLTTGTAQTFTYTLTATTANGCTATGTVAVTVNPLPIANAGPDLSRCASFTNQILGTPGVAGNSYSWSPTTGLSNPNIAQPLLTVTNPSTTVDLVTTYTLTVTSGPGCVNTDAVTVTVFPGAIAAVSPTAVSFCSGGSATIGNGSPIANTTYAWTPTTGLSDPTSPSPTVTLTNGGTTPGTATYTLTATTGNGCSATGTVAVTVNPNPVADAGTDRAFCSGSSATLGTPAVAGYSYSWSPTSGLNNPTSAQPTVTLTNTGSTSNTTIYTLTVSSGTNPVCSTQSTVNVTVHPLPIANAGANQSFCSGGTATLGSPVVAGYTYLWSPATGLSDPTSAQPTVTLTNTGTAPTTATYTLTVSSTTVPVCTSTSIVTVTVNPNPIANAGPNISTCSDVPSALLGVPAVAGYTYSWQPTLGLNNPNIAQPTVTASNTGRIPFDLTYTLTVSSGTNPVCSATSSVTVTINPAAFATPGPTLAICSGETGTIGGTAVVTGTTYSWTPTTGLSDPTAANPTVTLTNTTGGAITTNYTLTATTALGCVATATVAVTVNPLPLANAGPDISACVSINRAIGTAAVPGNTYAWTPTAGLSDPTLATPTVTLTNTSTTVDLVTTYRLTVTSAAGCISKDSVVVTVFPGAVAEAGAPATFCSGGTAQLGNGSGLAGTTYAWTPTTGLSNPTIANPTVTLTNTTAAPVTTTYTLTATTANSCVNTATVAITVNPIAVPVPGAAVAFCSGDNAQLGAAPVANTTYSWSPTTGLSDPAIANPTITLTNATNAPVTTTYTLTATSTFAGAACPATATVAVTVNPRPQPIANNSLTTCSQVPIVLSGVVVEPGVSYLWTSATIADLSDPTLPNPTATVTNATTAPITRTYTLTATNPAAIGGCTTTATYTLIVNPLPVVVPGPAATFCSGGSATLGAPAIAGETYSWSPATGLSSATAANPTVTLTNNTAAPIATTYTLTVTTALGCTATGTVVVTVNPAAIVDAGPDATLCALKSVTLGTPAQPGYTYSWTPTTGLSSATAAQPVFTAVNTGTAPITQKFYLTAATAGAVGACSARDSVLVTINPRPAPALAIVGPASVCPTVTGITYTVQLLMNPLIPFQWLVSGGTIASGQGTQSITVDWGPAGTGTVKAFTLNSFGCSSDTVTLPILINPILQTARPTGPTPVCQADGPYTYQTIYANGSLYSWTILGGTQVSTNLSSVVINWNPVTVPTIGKIVVQETSNPASGVRCLGQSDTLRVLINPSPLTTLAITGPARACQSAGSVTFTLPGGFVGSTYAFTFAGNPVPGATGNSTTISTLPAPGTYVVTARETTAQGCAGPLYTFPFIVDPAPAPITITGAAFLCDASVPVQYSVPNNPGSTYAWTVTNGNIISGLSVNQVTVQFNPGATSYTVSVTETSQFSCSGAPASLTVVPDSPSVVLAVASVTVSSNNSISLQISAPGSSNTPNPIQIQRRVAGTSNFVTVGTVPATTAVTTFTDTSLDASANSYEYQLSLTNGCNIPVVSIVAQTVRLIATNNDRGTGGRNQGTTQLTWNPYVGFTVAEYRIYRRDDNGNAIQVGTVAANGSTTYTYSSPNSGSGFDQCFRIVAVSTTGQLSNSNEACVNFTNPVTSYNVITPNGDGQNDVLVFPNITLYPGNTFTIFNRWGREVYNTTNYQNDWGGAPETAPGTYYYLLKMPNGTSMKGWFEIIK